MRRPRPRPRSHSRSCDCHRCQSNYEAQLREKQKHCNVHDHCVCLCCWDEEDDGVIPICRSNANELTQNQCAWWKIFNQHHTLTNNNALCFLFGTIGFRFFDIKRTQTMAGTWPAF